MMQISQTESIFIYIPSHNMFPDIVLVYNSGNCLQCMLRQELGHSSGTHRDKEARTRTWFIHVEARSQELGHGSYTWRQGEKNQDMVHSRGGKEPRTRTWFIHVDVRTQFWYVLQQECTSGISQDKDYIRTYSSDTRGLRERHQSSSLGMVLTSGSIPIWKYMYLYRKYNTTGIPPISVNKIKLILCVCVLKSVIELIQGD